MTNDCDDLADQIMMHAIYRGREGSAITSDAREDHEYIVAQEAAEAIWSAGWRKKPSREAVESHLEQMEFHWSQPWAGDVLDAVLALLDGHSRTGASMSEPLKVNKFGLPSEPGGYADKFGNPWVFDGVEWFVGLNDLPDEQNDPAGYPIPPMRRLVPEGGA